MDREITDAESIIRRTAKALHPGNAGLELGWRRIMLDVLWSAWDRQKEVDYTLGLEDLAQEVCLGAWRYSEGKSTRTLRAYLESALWTACRAYGTLLYVPPGDDWKNRTLGQMKQASSAVVEGQAIDTEVNSMRNETTEKHFEAYVRLAELSQLSGKGMVRVLLELDLDSEDVEDIIDWFGKQNGKRIRISLKSIIDRSR